jgi:hypothetical protein
VRDESLLSLELGRPSAQHEERFYALPDAAKAAIEVGKLSEAGTLAEELLELTSEFPDNWNYGNAIHDSHMGRSSGFQRGQHTTAK